VLGKKFSPDQKVRSKKKETRKGRFSIIEDASDSAMKILYAGLNEYVNEKVGDLRKKNPEVRIKLVLKNTEGQVVGGLRAYTTLGALHIEQLWIHEQYRRQGYGKELLINAEQIAQRHGCISGLAVVLSFQTSEFIQNCGYEIFGVSKCSPPPVKEYYLKKRF